MQSGSVENMAEILILNLQRSFHRWEKPLTVEFAEEPQSTQRNHMVLQLPSPHAIQ
jgi:hypothetical protein